MDDVDRFLAQKDLQEYRERIKYEKKYNADRGAVPIEIRGTDAVYDPSGAGGHPDPRWEVRTGRRDYRRVPGEVDANGRKG